MSLTGNDSRLPFALIFSLRSHFGRSRALSVFTIIAIAASVALASALEMSTRSVQLEIERTADALFGAAQLEVAAGGMGIPEDLVATVAETPGVLAASPLIDATFRLDGGPLDGQALHVLGVDFLSDRKVRGYEVTQRELAVADPLRLLTQVNAVIVTKELADRLGLREGDVLPARWSGRPMELVIRGLLLPGGVADAYSGQVAAMDIYSLQEQLGRRGWIDRVDVVANEGVEVDSLREAIQARVAGRAQVRRSASRNEYADRVFGTVSLGVWIVAVIGALVAVFLSYSTMSISVDRRIRELALLQSAGLEGRRVRRLVRTDALVLSSIGTVLGLAVGLAISRFFFPVFSGISGAVRNVEVSHLTLTASTLLVAIAVGIGVGSLGSFGPARRATSKRPLDVLRMRRRQREFAESGRRYVLPLLSTFGLVASWFSQGYFDALLVLALFGFSAMALMTSALSTWMFEALRISHPALDRLLPGLGSLVGTSLLIRPTQTALTTAAVAAIVGGISGILIVLNTVETTITDLTASIWPKSVGITARDPLTAVITDTIVTPEVVQIILSLPVIEAGGESFNTRLVFRGREVIFVNRDMRLMLQRGRTAAIGVEPELLARAMLRGEAAVSEAFARYFGFEVGDWLPLHTPSGERRFRIAGLVRDYVGPTGSIHLDINVFDRHWKRPGASGVVIWPKGDVDSAIEVIGNAVGGRQTLFFLQREEASKFVSKTLAGFFALIYGLGALASALGALAVLNVMFGAVAERRRELALLQSAGATRWQLSTVVCSDALLIAGIGVVVGLLLGLGAADPMLAVVSESLGWSLVREVRWSYLGVVVWMALGSAILAAVVMAASVRSLDGVEILGAA